MCTNTTAVLMEASSPDELSTQPEILIFVQESPFKRLTEMFRTMLIDPSDNLSEDTKSATVITLSPSKSVAVMSFSEMPEEVFINVLFTSIPKSDVKSETSASV